MEDSSDDHSLSLRAAQRGREKLFEVQNIYATLKHELEGDRFWRYERQVSPGLQEYIEALSFAHFLEHGSLVTFQQVQQTLCDVDGVPVRTRNVCSSFMCTIMQFIPLDDSISL